MRIQLCLHFRKLCTKLSKRLACGGSSKMLSVKHQLLIARAGPMSHVTCDFYTLTRSMRRCCTQKFCCCDCNPLASSVLFVGILCSASYYVCWLLHPAACTLWTGEVCVWNLSRETDSLVTTSGLGERTHRDPVTKVVWLSSAGTRSKLEQVWVETVVRGAELEFAVLSYEWKLVLGAELATTFWGLLITLD